MDLVKVTYVEPSRRNLLGSVRWLSSDGLLFSDSGGKDRVNSGFTIHDEGSTDYRDGCGSRVRVVQEAVTRDPIPSPAPKGDPAQAFKSDAGKVQYDLLEDGCGKALNYIAQVMSWAVEVKGYHPHSWREIPKAITRYRAALGRHRNAIARGEVLDPESGLPHWAHAACCVIFLLELENFDV